MYTLMNAVPPGPNRPNVNMNLVIFYLNKKGCYIQTATFTSNIFNNKFSVIVDDALAASLSFLMFLKSIITVHIK